VKSDANANNMQLQFRLCIIYNLRIFIYSLLRIL